MTRLAALWRWLFPRCAALRLARQIDAAKRAKWQALGRLKEAEERQDDFTAALVRAEVAYWHAELQRLADEARGGRHGV